METFVTFIHILACFILILVVLLQAGKGANMGAAFGGSSQTVFGSSGAGTFLGKLTATVAIVFMITSLSLAYMATKGSSSILERSSAPVTQEEPLPMTLPDTALPSEAPQAPVVPDKK
ncbi:MAG: preprotein translocase subunit SecG [Syntrophaceae bacterium]|nr:preprotein translocase subunit SecG [Syntrophaceae bacterium]